MLKKVSYILIFLLICFIFYTPKLNDIKGEDVKYCNVYIKGEVYKEGNYKVLYNSKTKDVLSLAGLKDESIYLEEEPYIIKDTTINVYKRLNNLDINKITYDEFNLIPGIGDAKSEALINYRKDNEITSYNELKEVLKLNDKTLLEVMLRTIIK